LVCWLIRYCHWSSKTKLFELNEFKWKTFQKENDVKNNSAYFCNLNVVRVLLAPYSLCLETVWANESNTLLLSRPRHFCLQV